MFNFLKAKESKNAMWLIGGKVCQMIISLLVSILTARYLGPSNYGLINYASAYISFFTSVCTLGINSVIIKNFIDYPTEKGTTIGTSIMLRFVSSVLSTITIMSVVAIADKEEKMTIVVVSLSCLSLIFNVFDTLNYWFQHIYQSKVTAIAILIAYLVTSAYKIVLLIFNKDVPWFAFATSIDYIVLALLLFLAYKRTNGPPLRFSFEKAKQLLKNSYHYILSGMMIAIYGQTDKLMLKHMMDGADVGYYSIATSVCSMWTFILTAIIDSLYPTILRLYEKDRLNFERKNKQLYAIVFYISILVSIFFTFCGEFIVGILYGQAYIYSGTPLRIVTWYTAFSYLGVARNAWIVSEGKQHYLKYMYCSAAIINVIMNYMFIPIWGASGAALASLITQVCTSIILPCIFKGLRPNAKLMLEAILLKGVF